MMRRQDDDQGVDSAKAGAAVELDGPAFHRLRDHLGAVAAQSPSEVETALADELAAAIAARGGR